MLNAMKGLDREWFTLEAEKDESGSPIENATAFQLAPLSGPDMAVVIAELSDDSKPGKTKALITAARLGIVDWRNLNDPTTNKPLKFNNYNIKHLQAEWLFEIGGRVIEISQMDDDEKKGLSSPSS